MPVIVGILTNLKDSLEGNVILNTNMHKVLSGKKNNVRVIEQIVMAPSTYSMYFAWQSAD